ncbi:Arylsulfatase [Novipirellula aureliae]|uniref:Arylsulfatase n=1 Tax=Novipirellula aureliae TaxID=2527966 RepID=A0A5C6DHX2_9BACT|nr:hypothetical protein [Novipirellula aureliae]TWU34596.1 Arylsulfatase [Novipirellula aureliae]
MLCCAGIGSDRIGSDRIGSKAVREEDWKGVKPKSSRDIPWELYNVVDDPTELNDLVGKYPEKVGEMSILWEEWKTLGNERQWTGIICHYPRIVWGHRSND